MCSVHYPPCPGTPILRGELKMIPNFCFQPGLPNGAVPGREVPHLIGQGGPEEPRLISEEESLHQAVESGLKS